MTPPRCKDCGPTPNHAPRQAPYPGPRCATHHRLVVKARAKASHERRMARTYRGLGPGDYDRLMTLQGGRCAICGRGSPRRKRRLPLDHDHDLNWPRGLLCFRCNEFVGYVGDDPDAAERMLEYLLHPPAWRIVGPPPERKE